MPNLKEQWADKITAWRESGQSIAAWCRQNDEGKKEGHFPYSNIGYRPYRMLGRTNLRIN